MSTSTADNSQLAAVLRIRMALPSLTDKERAIANHMLDLGAAINGVPIRRIADTMGASDAMIVKLAQKLGFSGYRELKQTLVNYGRSSVAGLHREINPADDAKLSVSKVFNTAIQSLQETFSVLDYEQLEAAAKAIANASQRAFYGTGGSGIVAEDASHKFLRIGLVAVPYIDAHLMAMSSGLLKKGDVALGVSYSGETRIVVDALSRARDSGATVIALTNFANSAITRTSDIVLHTTARGSALNNESVAARIAQLCLIDALFVRVVQGDYARSMSSLSRTMSSIDLFRLNQPSPR
ncbi:SIS domain-containing protein [Shinella daejeonensis]|uniref:SIS domain-containing protein n=1 Tax=Shinella daejeonensis TaxID=659017 RepID=UPI0020C762D0|nr:SIS domain-containing protein [Shinella daejeonensis]MCP8894681.1 SIS domain-containing protein [Shinella daejeonensis]